MFFYRCLVFCSNPTVTHSLSAQTFSSCLAFHLTFLLNFWEKLRCFMFALFGIWSIKSISHDLMWGLTQTLIVRFTIPSVLCCYQGLKPQSFRNPYDVPRSHLLDHLSRMRRNLLNTTVCSLRGQDSGKSLSFSLTWGENFNHSRKDFHLRIKCRCLLLCLVIFFFSIIFRPAPQRANCPNGKLPGLPQSCPSAASRCRPRTAQTPAHVRKPLQTRQEG